MAHGGGGGGWRGGQHCGRLVLVQYKASLREITVCSYSRNVALNRLRGKIPHVHGNTSRDTLKQRESLVTAS